MFSLESPHRGDSNEYTQYTIFIIKKKITLDYPKSASTGFFSRDSRMSSKRAISVRATEVLLYIYFITLLRLEGGILDLIALGPN